MSARAQGFLANWIEEFIATGQSPSADLASIALEEAADEGIGEDELPTTVGGDLNAYISAKLASMRAVEDEDAERSHCGGRDMISGTERQRLRRHRTR